MYEAIQLHTPTGVTPGPCNTEASAGETYVNVMGPKGPQQIKAVVLQFCTSQGVSFFYFDQESARRFSDAIREAAGGIVLPPPSALVKIEG